LRYRSEIDGLRALAIIPVTFFHAGFEMFSGGFVGVDVFFVISGYLITSIILAEKEAGTFSLVNFYERRARRILPSLFLVIAVSIPFAWVWLLPAHMKEFSESIVAVSTFYSNIFFWRNSGYFHQAVELKPFIHTWSLAVEEQYYILFPGFLLLAWKLGKRWIVSILIVVALVSLAFAQWGSLSHPTAAFYLLPTRGWELLVGVFVAFYLFGKFETEGNQAYSLLGFLLVTYPMFGFDKQTPVPGFYALIPTLGTALIILFATEKTFIYRVLSARVFVGIGLISYSAYLWQQPLFAFARHISAQPPDMQLMGLLSVSSFVLAVFSWRYVEKPFRNKHKFSRKQIFFPALACSAAIVLFGITVVLNEGGLYRFPVFQKFQNETHWPESFNQDEICLEVYGGDHFCKVGTMDAEITDALIGDSHANHFFFGLSKFLSSQNRNLLMQGAGGCPPFLEMDIGFHYFHGIKLRCHERTDAIYKNIILNPNIENVFLSFEHASIFDEKIELFDVTGEFVDLGRFDFLVKILRRTVKTFEDARKRVIILYDMPRFGDDVLEHCLLSEKTGSDACASNVSFIMDFEKYDKLLNEAVVGTSAEIFHTHRYLENFPKSKNGKWFYRDGNHLSLGGSMFFSSKYDFSL
jgi:peptidoglycan/LPS O-acetylase OafA/YrhL